MFYQNLASVLIFPFVNMKLGLENYSNNKNSNNKISLKLTMRTNFPPQKYLDSERKNHLRQFAA